jgi:diguanylate cyclase (GGDEF)-like protein/PAS domain S-box-containing protein
VERLSPLIRITVGLVLLTCSILILVDLLHVVPSARDPLLESRIRFCETLATQTTSALSQGNLAQVRSLLAMAIKRDDDMLSAALRDGGGRLLVSVGEHERFWEPPEEAGSTPTHVRIPVLRGGRDWADLEMRFHKLGPDGFFASLWERPLVRVIAFVAGLGFIGYFVYMRRTLRHLDPSAVVPTRVQMTLDVMTEGVVLVDGSEQIVLANKAFAAQTGATRESLLGTKVSALPWTQLDGSAVTVVMPWVEAIREGRESTGTTLALARDDEEPRILQINGAPVLDGWGRAKGAITTFDDVTELEQRRRKLEETLAELEKSRDEVRLRNDELTVLAQRDPLTGLSNRRAFLEAFDQVFKNAKLIDGRLSVLMVDIDHFKAVNDSHGHAVGDEVIRRMAEGLRSSLRVSDIVCRWGGEEFCVFLQDSSVEGATAMADRMRRAVASPGFASVPVTASFGVSSIEFGAVDVDELIGQADAALYASKESGRNRVTRWDQVRESGSASD